MQRRWARAGDERRLAWKADEKLQILAKEGNKAHHHEEDEMTAKDMEIHKAGLDLFSLPLRRRVEVQVLLHLIGIGAIYPTLGC